MGLNGHIYIPGIDPSEADIAKARELQKIKPPNCFCRQASRLKKVKQPKGKAAAANKEAENGGGGGGGGRGHQGKGQGQEQGQSRGGDDRGDGPPRPGKNNVKENSRAIGHYFFFCAKPKSDSTKCRFARPVEDELKPKKERLCAFLLRKGFCKKGDACKFSHDLSLKDDICPRATDAEKDGEEGQSDVDHDSGDDADQNTKDNSEICQAAKEEEIEKNSPADGDDGSSSSSSTSGTSSSSSSSGDSDSDSSDSDSD